MATFRTITWDEAKARLNRTKHRISFAEAATVFDDTLTSTIHDPEHSQEEERFATLGYSHKNKLLRVSHTWRVFAVDEVEVLEVRIISARAPTTREREEYEEGL